MYVPLVSPAAAGWLLGNHPTRLNLDGASSLSDPYPQS